MFKFSRYVTDSDGDVQTSGTVDVWVAGTSQSVRATIYADNGSPPTNKANPFSVPATGLVEFYLANQRFDVTTTTAAGTVTITDLLAFDVDENSGDITIADNLTVSESLTVNGSFSGVVPPGALMMYAAVTAPTGWLLCDGSAVSRTTYSGLFYAIGVQYGAGNGTSTFNVPDMRGRSPLGYGQGTGLTNRTLAANVGAETHTLSGAEVGKLAFTVTADDGDSATGANTSMQAMSINGTTVATNGASAGAVDIYPNSQTAHNIMHPSLVVNFIIKT